MKKRDLIWTVLLLVLIVQNYSISQGLQSLKSNQHDFVRRHDLDSLRNMVGSATNALHQVSEEKKWLQRAGFEVDPANSEPTKVKVQGEWTFGEMLKAQEPELLFREKGTLTWQELPLEHLGGLTYGRSLEVLPAKHYEYQLIAKGDVIKTSEIGKLPYEKYGLPTWDVNPAWYRAAGKTEMRFEFNLINSFHPSHNRQWKIARANLEVYQQGQLASVIPFKEPNRAPGADIARMEGTMLIAQWLLSDYKKAGEFELFTEVFYENGLRDRKPLEHFNEKIRYEVMQERR